MSALGDQFYLVALPWLVLQLTGSNLAVGTTIFVGAVGALAWFHIVQLWHLYLLAFAFGVADAFGLPAFQALLPALVEREQLPSANAMFQSMICGLAAVGVTMLCAIGPDLREVQ